MLPSLDSLQNRFNQWRQLSWWPKSWRAAAVMVPTVVVWPLAIGAGYALVVQARLRSAPTRASLISLMLVSALMAQGAWWSLLYGRAQLAWATTPHSVDVEEPVVAAGSLVAGEVAGAQTSHDLSSALVTVTKVVTGSWLEVSADGRRYQIQLIGITAPTPGSHEAPPACYGDESQRYLQGLIGTHKVQLMADGQLPDQDDAGRLYRYAIGQDGALINRQMVDAGMAKEMGGAGYDQKVVFMGAQEAAKAAKRGLWGACESDGQDGADDHRSSSLSDQRLGGTSKPTTTPLGQQSSVNPITPTASPTPRPTFSPTPVGGGLDALPSSLQLPQASSSP